jgi:hypothetical protein
MSYDYVDLGPVPAMETASDAPKQPELNRAECRIYKAMLERLHPVPEGVDAYYCIQSNPHDFGSYREVGIKYNENDRAAGNWAWDMQDNSPSNWDDQARKELETWKAEHMAPVVSITAWSYTEHGAAPGGN